MSLYFINDQHEKNYRRALLRWPQGKNDAEYQTACYILSVPMIFEKVGESLGGFEYPVSWIWPWEWKYTISKLDDFKDDAEDEETKIPYDLTGSMVQLGKLSLNLWNGYEHFNLMDCLNSVDDKNFNVVKCAIDMRIGKYMGL